MLSAMVGDAISALAAANEDITALQRQMMNASAGDREELRFEPATAASPHPATICNNAASTATATG